MADIFISYERSDHPRARAIAEALEQQGWSVWWDRKILPGATFDKTIEKALAEAKCVIVLWSKTSVLSDWVKDEASEGVQHGNLIPLLIDNVEIPLGFRRIQTARLTDWNASALSQEFAEVILAVRQFVSSGAVPKTEETQKEHTPKIARVWQSIATAESRHSRTLRIIALIALVGGLGGGLVRYWGGHGPQKSRVTQPGAEESAKLDNSGTLLAERIRQNVTIRAERSSEPVDTFEGKVRHTYSLWIEAPPQILNQIDKVLYHYDHPAFGTPRTQSSNSANGFRDSYTGIGAVNADMDIILVLRDGQQVPLKFNMYQALFGKQ